MGLIAFILFALNQSGQLSKVSNYLSRSLKVDGSDPGTTVFLIFEWIHILIFFFVIVYICFAVVLIFIQVWLSHSWDDWATADMSEFFFFGAPVLYSCEGSCASRNNSRPHFAFGKCQKRTNWLVSVAQREGQVGLHHVRYHHHICYIWFLEFFIYFFQVFVKVPSTALAPRKDFLIRHI